MQPPRAGTGGIFISYRRDDAGGRAGRLYDHLVERFGRDRVFMDIDAIGGGADFPTMIERAIRDSEVVIAVIGPGWAGGRPGEPGSRLDDPRDFVRLEIASALAHDDMLVVPVLVDGAAMPTEADLPADLRPLASLQAVEISDARWNYDVGRLLLAVGAPTRVPSSPGVKRPWGRVAVLAGLAALILATVTYLVLRSDAQAPVPTDARQVPVSSLLRPGSAVDKVLYADLDGEGPDEIVLLAKATDQAKFAPPQNYLDVFAWSADGWVRAFDATTFATPFDPEAGPPIQLAPTKEDVFQSVSYLDIVDMGWGNAPPVLVFAVLIHGAGEGPLHLYVMAFEPGDRQHVTLAFGERTTRGGTVSTWDSSVVLETGLYDPADAMCCPSRIERLVIGRSRPRGPVHVIERTVRPA